MARATNTSSSSSSLTLTLDAYASSAKSARYALPEALQAMCPKGSAIYVKLSILGGLVEKSGTIPATLAMSNSGFTPLSYCAVDSLEVPGKAEFASDAAFYDAVRQALGAMVAPTVKAPQETIVRPARTGGRTPKATAQETPVQPTCTHDTPPRRVTGGRTPSVKPLPIAAQATPENARIDAVETGLASLQASTANMENTMAQLLAAITGTPSKGKK